MTDIDSIQECARVVGRTAASPIRSLETILKRIGWCGCCALLVDVKRGLSTSESVEAFFAIGIAVYEGCAKSVVGLKGLLKERWQVRDIADSNPEQSRRTR